MVISFGIKIFSLTMQIGIYIFDNVEAFKSPGDVIIEIGERLYRDSFVSIKEINFISGILSLHKKGVI